MMTLYTTVITLAFFPKDSFWKCLLQVQNKIIEYVLLLQLHQALK